MFSVSHRCVYIVSKFHVQLYKGIGDERIGEGWTGGWRGGLTRYCFGSFMIIHGVYGIKQMYIKDSFK